jgi:hypothetical protein
MTGDGLFIRQATCQATRLFIIQGRLPVPGAGRWFEACLPGFLGVLSPMRFHLFRLVSGALVIISAAPGSANVTTIRSSATLGPAVYAPSDKRFRRSVQLPKSNQVIAVTYPTGCVANGTSSFVGENLSNYAGGAPYFGNSVSPGAGVMAGQKTSHATHFQLLERAHLIQLAAIVPRKQR